MKLSFAASPISRALALALMAMPALAAEPYPALPPTLSTSVTPNIMLYIDTSGSMLQDSSNNWMLTNLCNSNSNWSSCVNNNTNGYRTKIDSETTSPNTKMNIAKRVARNIINNNRNLRFGLFTFQDKPDSIGDSERGQAGKLRAPIANIDAGNQASYDALMAAINNMRGRTSTPLGEGLLEITRYFEGKSSIYGVYSGDYSSPIQYRCQKNFAIIITDGDATNEDDLPGSGKSEISYTARNSSGAAVAKKFSVCTGTTSTADDGLSVTCPASLEGSTATPGFGDSDNRFRALRDVAKYAYVADLRVGGTDLDKVSFDDQKFAKQNLNTYTIGFAVKNDVLPAAAKVGGGKYFTAGDESTLSAALNDAVSSIVASTSNAGGVATLSEVTRAGNKIYQPVFNPNGWYGELRCYELDSKASNGVGAACTPNAKAVVPSAASRTIFSSKVLLSSGSPVTSVFSFEASNAVDTGMTTEQRAALGASQTERFNTIKFLRGETVSGLRIRSNGLLGDIIDGQPTVVGAPSGMSPDLSYASYQQNNQNRQLVLIGANDGMLHAFNGSNMTEIMAYIPSAVYPRLKALTATDYGQSSGTPHTYHVNGANRQMDIRIGATNWYTYLVGSLGQGGRGYFAVDASNAATLATANAIKWEWTNVSDSDMGYTLAAPLIYNVRISATQVAAAVILANGYENRFGTGSANTSALYVVNAVDGTLIRKISVPGSTGLSAPAGVDYGQDGILDYVYAGDMNGKLWRFDLTAEQPEKFFVASQPVFEAKNTNGDSQPITMRPAVMPVNQPDGTAVGNLILFGTGKLLTDADRTDTSVQSFYGVLDDLSDTPTTLTRDKLQTQSVTGTATVSKDGYRSGTYRRVSSNTLDLTSKDETRKGWLLDFPVSTERLITSPLLLEDKLLFGTAIPQSTQKCLPGGKGWIMGLNPMTGSVTQSKTKQEYSFTDIKQDGRSSTDDKVSFGEGTAYVSGFEKDGIPTELSYVAAESKIVSSNAKDGGWGAAGQIISLREANSMGIYIGNAKPGVKTGTPMNMPGSGGKGDLFTGTLGNDTIGKDKILGAYSGARVTTTLWREIK